jgi:hypothetical protein
MVSGGPLRSISTPSRSATMAASSRVWWRVSRDRPCRRRPETSSKDARSVLEVEDRQLLQGFASVQSHLPKLNWTGGRHLRNATVPLSVASSGARMT